MEGEAKGQTSLNRLLLVLSSSSKHAWDWQFGICAIPNSSLLTIVHSNQVIGNKDNKADFQDVAGSAPGQPGL